MRLTFLGKDSIPDQSPTLYATDSDSYVVQGWIVTDPQILAMVSVSDDETVVEVPAKPANRRPGGHRAVSNRVRHRVGVVDPGQ